MNRLLYGLILVGIGLVFYLSWQPNPELHSIWFIPKWVADWTDIEANKNLRTGVPFLVLSGLVGLLPRATRWSSSQWLFAWLGIVAVVVVAEVGQLLNPTRHFDWADIGWGATGGFLGLLIARFLVALRS